MQQPPTLAQPQKSGSSLTSKLPPPKKTGGLSLPPPSASSLASKPGTSGPALPTPKKKAPKKITIGLPSISAPEADDDEPPAKRPRTEASQGAGKSGLLSMLPAPKNKNPVPAQQTERVLGAGRGPGLVFHTKPQTQAQTNSQQTTVEDEDEEENEESTNTAPTSGGILEEVEPEATSKPASSAIPFLPPHLARGKANISTEDKPSLPRSLASASASSAANTSKPVASAPAVDFFSLSSGS